MSQSATESDIWEYKPLKKTKRPGSKSAGDGPKKRKKRVASEQKRDGNRSDARVSAGSQEEDPHPGGFCPVCQMPFSILVVQSQQWHVAECLDTPGENTEDCPDGLHCTSSIPRHYKRYSHSLLAHSRSLNESTGLSTSVCEILTPSAEKPSANTANLSTSSSQISSSDDQTKGTLTLTNALQLLRSPNTKDIKKKKGWSPSVKNPQSQSSTQEFNTNISPPVVVDGVDDADHTKELKQETFCDDDLISYSPLSGPTGGAEDQSDLEIHIDSHSYSTTVQADKSEISFNEDGSLKLFSDDEDDDLFIEMLNESENRTDHQPPEQPTSTFSAAKTSLAPDNLLSTSNLKGASYGTHQEIKKNSTPDNTSANLQLQSPQSLVLERLRERLSDSSHINNLDSQSKELNTSHINQESILTQTISKAPTRSLNKAVGLKQTDIGVFFGLKPLKKENDIEDPHRTFSESSQDTSRRSKISDKQISGVKPDGGRHKKNRSEVAAALPDQPRQAGGGRGRAVGRKRWRRGGGTDGGFEEPKRCPFYKKIPGTGFAVDAFQYGVVEGVSAYFLTHFHSDHYNGLKKNSTFHIYCNKVTANLVRSKLKVDERYIHVLPMNSECTIEGVKVTLLEANHCPGAAMLLFVLPDGQTVLHTGDFRADPSMERYSELLGLRIQTLYLDTTYCSPEYTFPTQQEVITFAVNAAFEQVTLNPRTLIVCGSYAIGKEKVFLSVSEVLGSKVCLSRDKFNTMGCLELEDMDRCFTTDWRAAQVHVLPMMQLNFRTLGTHLKKFSGKYDRLVAFKPTGWTFSQTVHVEEIQPETRGNVSIYGIPYSEHSSYSELKRFVQWLRPRKIIPTVNVGSWKSRKAMENLFYEWLTDSA